MHKFFRYLIYFILFFSGCLPLIGFTQSVHSQLNNLLPNYVAIPHGQIEYYQTGQGTPIILISGYATDVSSWNRKFLVTLQQNHKLYIPNNRGVGKSKIASVSYQSEDLANDIYAMIQQLKIKKPTIIGISMGGMIAQKLAVLHPEVLGKLVLINTAISGEKAVLPSNQVKETLLNLSNKFGFFLTAIKFFFPPEWKVKMIYALIVEHFQPRNLTPIDLNLILKKQQQLILNWPKDNNTAEKLKKINIPVLILNGEADIIIPPINSLLLSNTIPHAKLMRWQDGGHAMIYQYPKEIGNAIHHFISAQ